MLSRGLCSTAAQKPPWGKVTPTAGQGQPRKSQLLTHRPFIFSDSVPGHSSWLRERMQTGKTHSFGRKPSFPPSLCLSPRGCSGCPLSSPWLTPPPPSPLCACLSQERGFCGFSHCCVLSSENPGRYAAGAWQILVAGRSEGGLATVLWSWPQRVHS